MARKRTILRSVTLLFVVLGLSAYALYLMTGHLPRLPAASAPGAAQSELGTLAPMSVRDEAGYQVMEGSGTKVYKWRDAQGRWHYGSRAPADARQLRPLAIEPSPAVVSPPPPDEPSSPATAVPAAGEGAPLLYSAEGVQQMLDRAEAVRGLMQERNRALQQAD